MKRCQQVCLNNKYGLRSISITLDQMMFGILVFHTITIKHKFMNHSFPEPLKLELWSHSMIIHQQDGWDIVNLKTVKVKNQLE